MRRDWLGSSLHITTDKNFLKVLAVGHFEKNTHFLFAYGGNVR